MSVPRRVGGGLRARGRRHSVGSPVPSNTGVLWPVAQACGAVRVRVIAQVRYPGIRYPISDPVDSTGVGGQWLGGPTAPKGMCRFRGGYAYPWRGLDRPRNRVACSRAVKVFVYWGSHLEDHGRAGGPLVMPFWIAERYWGRVAASVERIVLDA